jgi:predicted phage terminase large subunit-like protein
VSTEPYLIAEPKMTKYIPILPHPRQSLFLLLDSDEALFGGAAGGGKSIALMMAALQYVDKPNYSALLLRRTFQDLAQPDALMDIGRQWLSNKDVEWSEQKKRWTFPNGATISFGYLESESDKYHYQSAQYQFIGFDELTQFTETQYTYLFSRLRRTTTKGDIPLRMRAASNPGGVGHDWVKKRFIDPKTKRKGAVFIKSLLDDNPSLDQEAYDRSLANLDAITRRQLRFGDWTARSAGSIFNKEWCKVVEGYEKPLCDHLRYWDTAATKTDKADWSVGVKWARHRRTGQLYIVDVCRFRGRPHDVELAMYHKATEDGYETPIWIQEERGSAGKGWISSIARTALAGFEVRADLPTGVKAVRARPLSSAMEAGHIHILKAGWNEAFWDELELFTENEEEYEFDDQVDAAAGGYQQITKRARLTLVHNQPAIKFSLGRLYGR